MPDSLDDIHAWPASPQAFADVHLCPGCFTQITVPLCPVCGFALTDDRATNVLSLGQQIFALETERQRVIGDVRQTYRSAPIEVAAPAPIDRSAPVEPWWMERLEPKAAAAAVEARPAPTPPVEARPAAPMTRPTLPPPVAPAPVKEPRRRLSVPVLLLIVGVSLVGIAAIFFLVYAWFAWGILVRALIIGAITAASIAISSLLKRRSLTATAEGIAVLGVVLLALDAWALRANDFFGASQVPGVLYAGIGVLAVGVLSRVWAKLSGLRSPDVAAVLALPIGVGLLVGGVTTLPAGEALVAGLLGAAAGGLAHALPAPWSSARARADSVPERTTLAAIGVVALVIAAIVAAFVGLDNVWMPVWSGIAIIALGAAHAFLLRPRTGVAALPAAVPLAAASSSVAAAVAAFFGWQLALRADAPVYALLIGPVVAVAVAVLVDRLHARPAVEGSAAPFAAARLTTAAIGGVSMLAALALWLYSALQAITPSWVIWQTDAFLVPAEQVDGAVFAAIAAVLIAGLIFVAPSLGTAGWRGARIIAATVVVLTGVAVLAIPAALVFTAVVAAVATTLLLRNRALRVGAGSSAAIAATVAFTAGLATPWLWAVGLIVAIAVPIAAQVLIRPTGPAAGALTFAPIGVAAVSAFIAPSALAVAAGVAQHPFAPFVLLQWISVLAIAGAVALRCDATSRTTMVASGYALFVISLMPYVGGELAIFEATVGTQGTVLALLGEPLMAIVRAAVLLALTAVIAIGFTRVATAPAYGAAVLVAPLASLTTFVVLQNLLLFTHEAQPLASVGAAVCVVWAAAVWTMARPATSGRLTRMLVDIGALAVTLALAWTIELDLAWVMLLVVGLGFAGASITRGWAAQQAPHTQGVPSTRNVGASTVAAPRRLLAWPAFAFATFALWSALSTSNDVWSFTVESFLLPPAAGLLAFALLLVWLRRHVEAAVAITLSFTLGLVLMGLAGWNDEPIRGTIVAIVAAIITLALTCTPALRARIPALAGAVTALVALGVVTLQRAVADRPEGVLWLILLLAVAFGSAWGVSHAAKRSARSPWYSVALPPLVIAGTVAAGVVSAREPLVAGIAIAVLAALHLVAAAVGRDPFGAPTRWTALAGAGVFAIAGFVSGAVDIDGMPVVELVSLPIAVVVLVGSALAQWRQHRLGGGPSDIERGVWIGGLVLAVLPSIVAPVGALRSWLVVVVPLVAALAAVLARRARNERLRTSSAIVLTAAALLMGARTLAASTFDATLSYAEFVALVAGVGAIVVTAAMVWTAASASATSASTVVAGFAAALALATIALTGDGELVRSTLTAIIAAAVGVGGAILLAFPRWRALAAILAVGGLLGALLAVGARLVDVARPASATIEPDVWAVVGLAITAAVGLAALRATAPPAVAAALAAESPSTEADFARTVARTVGVAFAVALALFALTEFLLLGSSSSDALRTVFVMTALTLAAVGGVLAAGRLGPVLPIATAVCAGLFGALALVVHGVTPVELVTVPPALGLLALGARTLRRNQAARTWPTLGPGLVLLLVPSLLYDFGTSALWRVVALGIVAVALVVIGAVRRLQAPLVLGSVVVLIHAIAQLSPLLSTSYVYVPWWLWLGIGGVVLIFLAARYEKNLRAVRSAFAAVTSLR